MKIDRAIERLQKIARAGDLINEVASQPLSKIEVRAVRLLIGVLQVAATVGEPLDVRLNAVGNLARLTASTRIPKRRKRVSKAKAAKREPAKVSRRRASQAAA